MLLFIPPTVTPKAHVAVRPEWSDHGQLSLLRLWVVLAVSPVAFGVACGGGSPAEKCVPGASVECACSAGLKGVQTCTSAGTFAACQCPASGVADAAPDLATAMPDTGRGGAGGMTGTGGATNAGGATSLGGATSAGGRAGTGGATSAGGRVGTGGATREEARVERQARVVRRTRAER